MNKMKVFAVVIVALLLSSCAKEFNAVYKSTDYDYKYEFAKEIYQCDYVA